MEQEKKQLSLFRSVIKWISQGMVVISCLMLAVMMFLSTADVCGRYFFLRPIDGTWEIVSMAFVICGSMAIGYTQLVKGHIQINVISDRLSPRGQNMLFFFSYLVCLAGCALVGWQGWLRMVDYFHKTVGGETVTLGMPLWPFMAVFALGFFWMCIILIIDIYDCFIGALKR
jgi:TRAP-type C4-dicarboxylate transport system permease small subunit